MLQWWKTQDCYFGSNLRLITSMICHLCSNTHYHQPCIFPPFHFLGIIVSGPWFFELYSTNGPTCNPCIYSGWEDSSLSLTTFGVVIDVVATCGKGDKPCSGWGSKIKSHSLCQLAMHVRSLSFVLSNVSIQSPKWSPSLSITRAHGRKGAYSS